MGISCYPDRLSIEMTTEAYIYTGCEGEILFQSQEQVATAPGFIWLGLTPEYKVILSLLLRCTQKKIFQRIALYLFA